MKNSTIFIVTIIIILVVIVAGVIVYSNNLVGTPTYNQTPSNSMVPIDATATSSVVSLTNSGFSPSTITISNGDSVTFVNNSSNMMWVASNPHPTHTDLPGFDEKQSIAQGQSWTYTFSVAGTHGYHNHINPSNKGVVIVQ